MQIFKYRYLYLNNIKSTETGEKKNVHYNMLVINEGLENIVDCINIDLGGNSQQSGTSLRNVYIWKRVTSFKESTSCLKMQ